MAKYLNVNACFTRLYTKGVVENRIGDIRRFFPKKTDLRVVSTKRIKEVERLLNYRPIRKFNYNNPIEVLNNKVVALMVWTQPINMKHTLILLIVLAFSSYSFAQKVVSVEYQNQANVKVFVVEYENQADLKVFKVKYDNQAGDNDGKWFFTDYANQAQKKIFFVKYVNQADLKIYFVDYENQAGWKKLNKKHMLY